MAWIYLVESAACQRPFQIGSSQLPIVKTTSSLNLYSYQECLEVSSILPLFGTMLGRSVVSNLKKTASISFTAVSHVRTFLLLEMEKAWKVSEAAFFMKYQDLHLKFDQNSFSWKTSQLLLSEDFQTSLESLPAWGMTRAGQLFQPKKLEPITCDDDGSLLPTPMASQCGYQSQGNGEKRYMIPQLWKMGRLPTPLAREGKSAGLNSEMNRKSPSVSSYWKATTGTNMPVSFIEWIMGYNFGVTALEGWAIQWYRSRQKKHLKN